MLQYIRIGVKSNINTRNYNAYPIEGAVKNRIINEWQHGLSID